MTKPAEQQHQKSSDARGVERYQTDRELLSALAGEDVINKLSDAECSRFVAKIAQLIATQRQKDFETGWFAGFDHAADYAEAFFAPKTKAH